MRTSFKYLYVYLFLFVFLIIGFICGYIYCSADRVGDSGNSIIDISQILSFNATPLLKDIKISLLILISSFAIIVFPYAGFKLFFFSFSLGFLFHLLIPYGFLFAFLYLLFYLVIPFLFLIVMFRVGFSITKNMVLLILKKERFVVLKKYIKKYILLMIGLFIYECLIFLFSGILNGFLSSLIK